jgi:hypothetical protein
MEKSYQIQLEEIKAADILIGIPSYNNARTIGHVVRAVIAGLAKYFPTAKAVMINSDGGSTDGTQDEVRRVQAVHGAWTLVVVREERVPEPRACDLPW